MEKTRAQSKTKRSPSALVRSSRGPSRPKRSRRGFVEHFVYQVHGKKRGTVNAFTPAKVIQSLKTGLPIQELNDLRASLDLSMEKLAPMLGISKATLHRRRATGRLDSAESDRVIRFAKLMGQAVEVMESPPNARKWLASPQIGLGGAIPLEYAETEVGAREVENLLGRIEYGVYS